ncbi:kinase-like domain-containing protein [Flammula alnicola]|nr:kinase-like domain-containing protein [Flammula alnicola]
MVLHPLGTSIEALRLSNPECPGTLPMHIVQQVVCQLVGPLRILENRKVIHGAVTPDNFLFASVNAASDIERAIETAPPPIPVESVTGNDGMVYPVVKSQSIGEEYSTSQTTINLSNFGHASLAGGNIFLDAPLHLLPPEAVGGRPQLTTQTNIWQLGCTAYLLVTGKPLLSDSYVKSPEENLSQTLDKLEELLASSNKLSEQDIILMAQFLRSCLAVEPADRPIAGGLREYAWVKAGSMCSCGWHEGDNLLPKSSFV